MMSSIFRDCNAISDLNRNLLEDCISRNGALQRSANHHDMLPYLRSMIRSDLLNGLGKRRRKPRSQNSTARLPSVDLILATQSAIELSNAL